MLRGLYVSVSSVFSFWDMDRFLVAEELYIWLPLSSSVSQIFVPNFCPKIIIGSLLVQVYNSICMNTGLSEELAHTNDGNRFCSLVKGDKGVEVNLAHAS